MDLQANGTIHFCSMENANGNHSKPQSVLECMTKIFENKEKLMRRDDVKETLAAEIQCVQEFLTLEDKLSILLSVMVCEQLLGEPNPLKKTMRFLGFGPLDIISSNESVKILKKKGWISINKRGFGYRKTDEYEISKHLLHAVTENDTSKLQKQMPETLAEALLQIREIISNTQGDYEVEDFTQSVIFELESYTQFKAISDLLKNEKLIALEKIVLIWMASDLLYGREEFDLSVLLDSFAQDPSYAFWFKQRIVNGTSVLVSDAYLTFKRPGFMDFTEMKFGETLLEILKELLDADTGQKPIAKQCKQILPEDLMEMPLYFNPKTAKELSLIDGVLSEVRYTELMASFKEKGLNPALTMLFHGLPGTGKTEFVKQMAKKHQRVIYQVDIAGIKDMWVGESEKNLKRVFKEYAAAVKYYKNTPILLFNEADAILGTRMEVRNAVDQTFNAMQNILLQELEDFTGIFIGTTNLITNIDSAFDRRFLFKQKFDLPDAATRLSILKGEFPDRDEQLLLGLTHSFQLSGAQIQNVKRKLLSKQLLEVGACDDSDEMTALFESEVGFRSGKATIGFNQTTLN